MHQTAKTHTHTHIQSGEKEISNTILQWKELAQTPATDTIRMRWGIKAPEQSNKRQTREKKKPTNLQSLKMLNEYNRRLNTVFE